MAGHWQLRVLTLLPCANHHGPIQCRITNETFKDIKIDNTRTGQSQGYEALSYVWKDELTAEQWQMVRYRDVPSAYPSIEVNGIMFSVTRNLEAALRRLRHKDIERRLWVDQICID